MHQVHAAALALEAVHAHKAHALDAQFLGGDVGAVGHGVALGHHHVRQFVAGDGVFLEAVLRLILHPVGHQFLLDDDVFLPGDGAGKAAGTRGHGRRVLRAEDLHHAAALLAEHLRHLLPGHVADFFVVRADEEGVILAADGAVKHDDGDLFVHLGQHRPQRLAVVGGDDQQVDAVAHQHLHIGDLPLRILRGVCVDDAQIVARARRLGKFQVHRHPPGLDEVGLTHAHQPDARLLPAHGGAADQPRHEEEEHRRRKAHEGDARDPAPALHRLCSSRR